jgi:hypothetical protein
MEIKEKINIGLHKAYGSGFWIVILIMIGFYIGITWCERSFDIKFNESIKLGGVLYKSKVYDIKERVQ